MLQARGKCRRLRRHGIDQRDQGKGRLGLDHRAITFHRVDHAWRRRQILGDGEHVTKGRNLLAIECQDQIARHQLLHLGRQRGECAHARFFGRTTGEEQHRCENQDRKDEIEHRPRRNRSRTRPKRRTMHGASPLGHIKRIHRRAILAAGGIRIAQEFHIPPERQRRDLPARAVPVRAAKQDRAETDREDLGMDTRPTAHDVMAIFMDRHDDGQGRDESRDREGEIAELGNEFHRVLNAPFL